MNRQLTTQISTVDVQNYPKTVDEYLKYEGITDWPHALTSEQPLALAVDERGNYDELMQELKDSTPIDLALLNSLEARLDMFDQLLYKYAEQIYELQSKKNQNELVLVEEEEDEEEDEGEKAFLTDVPNQTSTEAPDQPQQSAEHVGETKTPKTQVKAKAKKSKSGKSQSTNPLLDFSLKKSITNCEFPGFKSHEFTELPHQLEAPHILNRVSRAQKFKRSFGEMWKKIFLSEASVACLQDTFWWIYLDKFQGQTPDAERDIQMAELYNRIADNFVSLFVSVNPEVKDKVFSCYVECFAQSLYAAYYEAFPDSLKLLQDDFKEYLMNLASVWVTGCPAPAECWKNWDVEKIVPREKKSKTSSAQEQLARELTLDKPVSLKLDMESFHETLDKLSRKNPDASVGPSRVSQWVEMSKKESSGGGKSKVTESHVMGPGSTYSRVRFKLAGRSPLVSHFLRMRNMHRGDAGKEMKRLEVKPDHGEEGQKTYRALVEETKDRNQQRVTHYQKLWEETEKEIATIEAQKRETNRKIRRLEEKLMSCRGSMEIKLFAEKHLDQAEVDGKWILRDEALDDVE